MKNENQVKEDINGRLHSLDQTIRSVERRLRAVERRLSVDVAPGDSIPEFDIGIEEALLDTRNDIASIISDIEQLKRNANDSGPDTGLQELSSEIVVLREHIRELREENSGLRSLVKQQEPGNPVTGIKEEIADLNVRLEKAENRNRINIGSVRVPMELSGIVGALTLTVTGMLITAGRWDVIRSAYFSFGIAIVFTAAVLLKFYMSNRRSA